QRLADENAGATGDVRLEILPIGEVDGRRGRQQAVDQRSALGVENPYRLQLRQRSDELLQPQMQRFLAGLDTGVGNAADDLVDFRKAAVDGLEHFQRVFVGDVQGALDLPVGGIVRRKIGNRGR